MKYWKRIVGIAILVVLLGSLLAFAIANEGWEEVLAKLLLVLLIGCTVSVAVTLLLSSASPFDDD